MKKTGSDIKGMITQVQQQLTYLDKKIDTLMGRIPERPAYQAQISAQPGRPQAAERHPQRQFQHPNHLPRQERILHKAVCADCRKECEVPFRPTGDRPVYCKECFAKRKTISTFKPNMDNRLVTEERAPAPRKHAGAEYRKPHAKKKAVKARKKR